MTTCRNCHKPKNEHMGVMLLCPKGGLAWESSADTPVFDEGEAPKEKRVFDPGVNYGKSIHHTEFSIGQQVNIDGDRSIKATVLGIMIRPGSEVYQVGWVQDGHAREPMIESFRLSAID